MIPRPARAALAGLAAIALACAATPAHAAASPDTLADSTWVDRWRLKNGLEVTVRHVPGASGIATVVAWRVGRNQDPRGRSGLADLVCEVLYTSPAGDVPERSREEMATLRPLGWNTQVAPRFSLVSEVASASQFPGVLRQVAARLRGVTVTDSIVRRARRTLVGQQGTAFAETPHAMLFNQIREMGLGVTDQEMLDRISGRTMSEVTARDVSARLQKLYVPANAVLALAGDLDGFDVHAMVARLFEDIPGGVATPEPPLPPLTFASRAVRRPTMPRALLGVGIIGPALSDTSHATFYFHSLVMGRFCDDTWAKAEPPLQSRFRFPVLADEQIVQFFPPVQPKETNPEDGTQAMLDVMDLVSDAIFPPEQVEELRLGNEWIFGGQLTGPFKQILRQRTGALHTLASTLAIRALWGSDEFWSDYLARYRRADAQQVATWIRQSESPAKMIRVLFTPAK